jgi:hypothetical protein
MAPDGLVKKLGEAARNPKNQRQKRYSATNQKMLDLYFTLKKMGGQNFTSMQVVTALAFEHGLEESKLLPFINAVASLNKSIKAGGSSTIQGEFTNYQIAVKSNCLKKGFDLLSKTGKSITGPEIASLTGTNPRHMSTALTLLEAMGLVTKLPAESGSKSAHAYKWIIAEKRFSPATLPSSNIGFNILMALGEKPAKLSDLIVPTIRFGKTIGSEKGIGKNTSVKVGVYNLIRDGFAERAPAKGTAHGIFRLTPKGRALFERQKRTPYLLPELRRILLGKRVSKSPGSPKLTSVERSRLTKIHDYVKLRLEWLKYKHESTTGKVEPGSYDKIRAKFGVPYSKVSAVSVLFHSPWSSIGKNTMMEKYIPALKEIDPEAGEWLRVHIKNKFEKKENPYSLAKETFMKERGFNSTTFALLEEEFRSNHQNARISDISNIAQAIAKKTNLPFSKAQAFVSWVVTNKWEELIGKTK